MQAPLLSLSEPFREIVITICGRMEKDGVLFTVTRARCTVDEQFREYRHGRDEVVLRYQMHGFEVTPAFDNFLAGPIITNCDGMKERSKHQDGLAVDIVPCDGFGNPRWPPSGDMRWQVIGSYFLHPEIVRGMDWKDFPDFPHYEYKGA